MMPNWSDDEGRYWYTPPGAPWYEAIQIPYPPVSVPRSGCKCRCCADARKRR